MKKGSLLRGLQPSTIRVILVDDSELVRAGIKSLIAAAGDIAVIGEAKDSVQAVDLIQRLSPDVIVLSLELGTGDALGMIPDLIAACKTTRLAVLTASSTLDVHRKALSKGAVGAISKTDTPDSLLLAIRQIHSGGVWLNPLVSAKMVEELSSGVRKLHRCPDGNRIATLTNREREVVRLAGEGLRNKQIAGRLFISPVTVHHHLTTIYSKLDVRDRLELIVYAYKNGLAEVPH